MKEEAGDGDGGNVLAYSLACDRRLSKRPVGNFKGCIGAGARGKALHGALTWGAQRKGLIPAALVAEGQGDALRLGPDADVARQLAVLLLLHAEVHQRVLPENALGVQVGCQEAAVALQSAGRRQAPAPPHTATNSGRCSGQTHGTAFMTQLESASDVLTVLSSAGDRVRGVRRALAAHLMLVLLTMWSRNSLTSPMDVFTAT